jgi:hypothetical protein
VNDTVFARLVNIWRNAADLTEWTTTRIDTMLALDSPRKYANITAVMEGGFAMAKTKVLFAILLGFVGFFLVTSCATPKYVLRFDCEEGGYYAVDVARWDYVKVEQEVIWFYYQDDATVNLSAYYFQPGVSLPTYPGIQEAHLQSYRITWTGYGASQGIKIPTTTGALDVLVPADVNAEGSKVPLSLMVIPGVNKDTVGVLAELRADPESQVFFNGEINAKGHVVVNGIDKITDEPITAEFDLNVVFADYKDPNKAH